MNKNQIGWQKYEDMLEDQMQSPLLLQLYKSFQDTLYSEAEMQDIEHFTDAEIEEMQRQINKEAGLDPEDGGVTVPSDTDGVTRYPSIDGEPIPADDLSKYQGVEPPEKENK